MAKNGLLYIAHSKGLSSFDGIAIKNYYNKVYPFTEVSNIMETEDGTILCKAFNNSVYRLDQDDSLINLKWFPTKTGFSPSAVYKNTIIGIYYDSVSFYDVKTKYSRSILIKDLKDLRSTNDIIFAAYAKIDTGYGFVFVDKNWNCTKTFFNSKLNGQLHIGNGKAFIVKQNKSTDISDITGKLRISLDQNASSSFVNFVTFFDDTIWICTTKGLYYASGKNPNQPIQKILDGQNVTNIVRTGDNTHIVSTMDNGLICIPNFKVATISNLPSKIHKLFGNKDRLFMATESGYVISYDKSNHHITTEIKVNSKKKTDFVLFDTLSKTLISSGESTVFKNATSTFSTTMVIKDYTYTNNGIMLATNGGLFYYSTNSTPGWWMKNKDPKKISQNGLHRLNYFDEPVFSCIYSPEKDKFYFNSYTGMLELSETDQAPKLLPEPNCVLSDMKYFDQKVLLITKDKGILEWNGDEYKSAFPNTPRAIFYKGEIFQNQLWLLAEDAIYCYDKSNWFKYDSRFGIDAADAKGIYVHDSIAYINTGENILHFPIDITQSKSVEARLLVNKVTTPLHPSTTKNNSILSYKNNSLLFDFNILNYSNGDNCHLAYSINNETLIHLNNTTRQLQLNHLMPSDYIIKFYIVQDNVVPEKPNEQFVFTIKPPFYKTWWFTILLLILIAGIVFTISRQILFRWKKEARLEQTKLILEKELDKSMLSSIKAQMNPHFLFNALNTIQSYIYMNDKYNASIYISKFSDLTRNILDSSNKENISLDEEINSLTLYLDLEKMRFEDSFIYEIDVDINLNKELIKIPSMLIQPYVENAIKHGLLHKKTDRRLLIKFEKQQNKLVVSIDDNGIGRKRSQELNTIKNRKHHSFAMDANKKRLEILKNNFKDISFEIIDKYSAMEEAIGTKVIISLPIISASQD